MLKTALKPRWIGFFILTMSVAVLFMWLTKWQLEQSVTGGAPPRSQTETPVELIEHLTPGEHLTEQTVSQMVTFNAELTMEKTVQVANRKNGEEVGYWLITQGTVAGAPAGEVLPVAWAWMPDQLDLDAPEELNQMFTEATGADPNQEFTVTARVALSEGPIPGTDFSTLPITTQAAGSSELANLWDEPIYPAVVAAEEFQDAAGATHVVANTPEMQSLKVAPPSQEVEVVWLNVFYAIEWTLFAIFSLYLWWRFVRDDYLKDQRELQLDALWETHWKQQELARLREKAAREKAEAIAAYNAYHASTDTPSSKK